MKVQKPYIKEIIFHIPEGYTIETWLEKAGRTCYKSEDKITEESAPKFIRMLRDRGHWAMLEHGMVSAIISADRGLTHEQVRHRPVSYGQESTRYCNYSKGKFNNEITVIEQDQIKDIPEALEVWLQAMRNAEESYMKLLNLGIKPQNARSVLPIAIKSDIVVSTNFREWAHIFSLRCDTPAHPIIKKCSLEILRQLNKRLPSIYEKQAEQFLLKD